MQAQAQLGSSARSSMQQTCFTKAAQQLMSASSSASITKHHHD
jgi:hypothetical protein